jgi:hypothetical protein
MIWMLKFVQHRVADRRILRLIQKWLKAGVMEEGVMVGDGDGYAAGGGDYGLNAKDNFEFDRAVRYRQEGKKR